jgi:transcriptional regulator with XRE-family HTH domain
MENFKDRLAKSCDASVDIPDYGHGRQVYIAKAMSISQEGVRKWFAGESKPRTAAMKKLATLLNVDYAWLSLGSSLLETEKFRAVARQQDAGVYALTSFLISNGYTVAFTEDEQDESDITAFINGKVVKFLAKTAASNDKTTDKIEIANTVMKKGITPVGCISKSKFNESEIAYDFLDLSEMVKGATHITLDHKNKCYKSGQKVLQPLSVYRS